MRKTLSVVIFFTVIIILCVPSSSMAMNPNEAAFSQSQFDMLMRCSVKGDMTEWNEWRKKYPNEKNLLERARFYHSDEPINEKGNVYTLFKSGKIKEANLRGANIRNACLTSTDLVSADLSGASLVNANLSGADLRYANLSGADLEYANLSGARLSSANLSGADLRSANLSSARLSSANLSDASLRYANLSDAKLNVADLRGANLSGANLRSSDFTGTIIDGSTSFLNCRYDDKTNFTGSGLDNARMSPEMNTQLKNNIRRISWEQWYDKETTGIIDEYLARAFWWVSDYGSSTTGIFKVMLIMSLIFCILYLCFSILWAKDDLLSNMSTRFIPLGRNSFSWSGASWPWLFLQIFCFACASMVTFGLSEINVNIRRKHPTIILIVMFNLMTGYFLLACIVARIGIMFGALGP